MRSWRLRRAVGELTLANPDENLGRCCDLSAEGFAASMTKSPLQAPDLQPGTAANEQQESRGCFYCTQLFCRKSKTPLKDD